MRSDITPGGTFPDYELPDHTRTMRRLSELQGDDPLIVTLARGHYCPKEHQQHLDLAAFQSKMAVAYEGVRYTVGALLGWLSKRRGCRRRERSAGRWAGG